MGKISDIITAVKLSSIADAKNDILAKKDEWLARADELINISRLDEILDKREEEKRKKNCLWIFAVIGAVALLAAICYAVYRFFTPDSDEFEDYPDADFDDEFDEDIFAIIDDEEEEEEEEE